MVNDVKDIGDDIDVTRHDPELWQWRGHPPCSGAGHWSDTGTCLREYLSTGHPLHAAPLPEHRCPTSYNLTVK